MSRHTHVYGWDQEPTDERPSEFMASSGYSALSGYHVPRDLSRRVARRRGRSGFAPVLAAGLVLLGLCGVSIHVFVKLLHG